MPNFTAPYAPGLRASLNIARIAGIPTKFAWGQVHTFAPEETKVATHGFLTTTISLDLESEEAGLVRPESQARLPAGQAIDVGHEVLIRLNEEYYGKEVDKTPFATLKNALSNLAQEFANVTLEITAAVVWKKYIYYCTWGASSVYLYRGDNLNLILNGKNNQLGSCSGEYKDGDIFLFGTSSFFEKVDRSALEMALYAKNAQDIADNLAPFAHRSPTPKLAGVVIKATVSEELKNQETEEPTPQAVISSDVTSNGEQVKFRHGVGVSKLKNKALSFFGSLKKRIPSKEETLETAKNRKTAVSVGLILLALLIFSIAFGIQQKKSHDYKSSYQQALAQAESDYNDSLLQKDYNGPLSRELFNKAQLTANSLKAQGIKDPRLESLLDRLGKDSVSVLGRVEATPTIFLDLSLVRSGVSASKLVLNGANIAALDVSGNRVITVATSNKETKVLGSDKLSGVTFLAVNDNKYYVFAVDGVFALDAKGAAEIVIEKDSTWGDMRGFGAFGGNLYLLDPSASSGQGKIWRYPPAGGLDGKKFAAKQDWLKTSVDLGGAADMAIDGSLWILSSEGKMQKLTRGTRDAFKTEGVEGGLSSADALYTDEKLENIYVLDKKNNRILEISKSGQYKKQYQSSELGNVKDFVVSSEKKLIFLLTDTKILTIGLQ